MEEAGPAAVLPPQIARLHVDAKGFQAKRLGRPLSTSAICRVRLAAGLRIRFLLLSSVCGSSVLRPARVKRRWRNNGRRESGGDRMLPASKGNPLADIRLHGDIIATRVLHSFSSFYMQIGSSSTTTTSDRAFSPSAPEIKTLVKFSSLLPNTFSLWKP